MCELGESGEKQPGLRIGLEMGLGRRVKPSEAESDVRGERGPKPSVGGFFGLTFANRGICIRGRPGVAKKTGGDSCPEGETVCAGEGCCVGRSG